MSKDKIDSYHWHEVWETSWTIIGLIDKCLTDHPAIISKPEIKKRVDAAINHLLKVNQMAASEQVVRK